MFFNLFLGGLGLHAEGFEGVLLDDFSIMFSSYLKILVSHKTIIFVIRPFQDFHEVYCKGH